MYVPDNYDAFEQRETEQQKELDKLPQCCYCDEPIQDEYCYEVNDEPVCESCLIEHFRKRTDDFIE